MVDDVLVYMGMRWDKWNTIWVYRFQNPITGYELHQPCGTVEKSDDLAIDVFMKLVSL